MSMRYSGRLREVNLALFHQLRNVAIDERQEQRRDVITVRVRIGQDDQLPVAQPREVEVLAETAPERRDQIRQLFVLEHFRERRALGVQHLARAAEESPGASDRAPALPIRRPSPLRRRTIPSQSVRILCSRSAYRAGSTGPTWRSCASLRPAPHGWPRARGPPG